MKGERLNVDLRAYSKSHRRPRCRACIYIRPGFRILWTSPDSAASFEKKGTREMVPPSVAGNRAPRLRSLAALSTVARKPNFRCGLFPETSFHFLRTKDGKVARGMGRDVCAHATRQNICSATNNRFRLRSWEEPAVRRTVQIHLMLQIPICGSSQAAQQCYQ